MPRLAAFLALSLIPWCAPHANAQETFTAQHVAKTRVVVSAAVSPDGTQVAYVLAVPRTLP